MELAKILMLWSKWYKQKDADNQFRKKSITHIDSHIYHLIKWYEAAHRQGINLWQSTKTFNQIGCVSIHVTETTGMETRAERGNIPVGSSGKLVKLRSLLCAADARTVSPADRRTVRDGRWVGAVGTPGATLTGAAAPRVSLAGAAVLYTTR
jgi:hypothetical protein